MKEPNFRKYYELYLNNEITREEIIKQTGSNKNIIDKRFEIFYRERLKACNSSSHLPCEYLTEFSNMLKKEKKEFLVSDWQTMTDEEKELYL